MTGEIIEIGCHDTRWHAPFFRHVADAFGDIDFQRWAAAGGWGGGYSVMALLENDQIVSTVGVSRMQLVLRGGGGKGSAEAMPGLQLGAVATRADRQGRGYAGALMQRVLASADTLRLPVLLFANSSVTDFYPRFGFHRLPSHRAWTMGAFEPSGAVATPLDPTREADRRLLSDICTRSIPHGGALSAAPEPSLPLWYLCNGLARALVLDGGRSIVFVTEADSCLRVHDWLGPLPVDPLATLCSVMSAPVARIEFGFLPPCGWFGDNLRVEPDDAAFMYWRAARPMPPGPLLFPEMLMT